MKQVTLGVKIAIGFGIILAIMLILGIIGVVNMNSGKNIGSQLDEMYAPQVDVATRIERNIFKLMYEMRNYNYTGDEKSMSMAQEYLKRSYDRLKEAEELAKKHPELKELDSGARNTEASVSEYDRLISQTIKAREAIAKTIEHMNTNARAFMNSSNEYLKFQTEEFYEDVANQVTGDKLKNRYQKTVLINDVIDLGNTIRIENFKAQSTRNMQLIRDVMKNFDLIEEKLNSILKVTSQQINMDRVSKVRESAKNYKVVLEQMMALEEELSRLNLGRVKAGDDALKFAEEVSRGGVKTINKLSNEASSSLSLAATIMMIGLAIAFLIGVISAFLIIRSITKPITRAVESISDANAQVVSASEQISSASQTLADGATQQASSVEEVSASVEETTAVNSQNADNAREADILAKESNEAATVGNHKIKELMDSMRKITEASQQIAKIVKTIDEIAFQTNLLALNAAVEAARAGEYGLGFAVVADEVKNLAQRSASAAKETTTIIEQAIDLIKQGSNIAEETNSAFNNILDRAKKTSNLIGEIAISTKEQAEGMNQIAQAMGTIDQVTQQNAATSEEAAAAAEELNAQALAMLKSVEEVANLVGVEINISHTSRNPHQISKPKKIEPIHLTHKTQTPAKKIASRPSTPQRGRKDDDVFPLDESDLKEF